MSLFTFNSEPDVEGCVTDEPVSVGTLVFIVCSFVVGIVVSGCIASNQTEGAYRILDEANWDEIELVVLGDSTEARAIDTSRLSRESLNLSVPGSGYSTWLPVLKGAVSRSSNLRFLLISCDPMSRMRDGLSPRGDDLSDLVLRGAYSKDLEGIRPAVKFETYLRYETFLSSILTRSRASWSGVVRWLNIGSVSPKDSNFEYNPAEGALKKQGYLRYFNKQQSIGMNDQSLHLILAIAKAHGLKIVLVRTPVTREFMEEEADVWEIHYQEILEIVRIEMRDEEVLIFDGSRCFAGDQSGFSDPNHLNASGARIFSLMLDGFMSDSFPWHYGFQNAPED